MRKFKKSLDSQLSGTSTTSVVSKESEDEMPAGTPLGTPRTTRGAGVDPSVDPAPTRTSSMARRCPARQACAGDGPGCPARRTIS